MIKYKYVAGWDANLKKNTTQKPTDTISALCELHVMSDKNKNARTKKTPEFITTLVQFMMNTFDTDKTLLGLFRLIKYLNKHQISPFLATHDYCVSVLSASMEGAIELNISPIYHLGPEYPDYYEQKAGKALEKEAIIGLRDIKQPDPDSPGTFDLGIDAGIAFKNASIPHNKNMTLNISLVDEGVMASLQCEGQATSRVFIWDEIGVSSSTPHYDLYSQKIQDIWAA